MMKHKSAKSTRNGRGKNSVRRILAGVLILCMLVTILPGTSLTAGAAEVGNEAVGTEEILDATNPDATNPDATTVTDDVSKPADQEDAVTPEARNVTPRASGSIEYVVNGGAPQYTTSIVTAADAMKSATDPTTSYIKLLASMTATVDFYGGKFTLDLNGKTWDTNQGCTISGAATHITIKDSAGGGKIERIQYSYAGNALDVLYGAELTLNSGTIEASTRKGYAINACSKKAVDDGGLITINGGTIRQVQNQGSASRSTVHLGVGGLVMTGGTIESDSQAATLLLYGGNNSIKGGTIKNTGGERAVGIAYNGTLDISGGTMTASGSGSMSYAIYGYSNKATIRLSGAPTISGNNAKIYAQKDVSLQANIDGSYYTGDAISIFYKDEDQQMGTTLVTGLKDATQAAKFSLSNQKLSGGTPYDDTKKTIFIGELPAEAQWTTNGGTSGTKGSFVDGVAAMKSGATNADNSTLQLLTDINTLANAVTLSSNLATAYTLDLNGKTLNAANKVNDDFFAVDGGTVVIEDSTGNGQIKGWDNSSAAALLRVNNDSTLILKSGTLTSSAQGIFVTTGTTRIEEGGRIESYDEAVYGSGNCSIDILGGELQSQTTNLITTIGTLRLYGSPELTAGKDCSTIAAYAAGKIYACSSDGSVSYTGSPVTISCNWNNKKSGDIVVQGVTDPTAAGLFTATDIEPLVLKTPDNYPGDLTLAAKKLTGIAITIPPTKTAYRVGDPFDPAGMVVTATYDDATEEEITAYTVTPSGALTASDTTIKVSYTVDGIEKSAEQKITVEAPFTVKFDVDGTVTEQKVFNDEMATPPAEPTKTGYTFKGWFATGQDQPFDFATPIKADLTLTAKLVDETAPIDVKILYDENGWEKFANTATFGLFFKDTVNVQLTATDEGSGVKEFTYTLGDVTNTISAKNGVVEFSIAPGYKGNISNVTATDNDNNKSDPAVGTGHFAIDKEVPGIPTVDTGTYTSGKWTKDDVTFTLSGASATSGIAKYQYSTNEGKDWTDAAVVTKTDATETEPFNVTEAKVEVKDNCKDVSYVFRAVSNAESKGTNSAETVVSIDKVQPVITVTGKTDVYVVDDTAQLVVTAGESKITKVEVKKDSDEYKAITDSYTKGYEVTENGTYTFRVTNGAQVTSEASIEYKMIDPRKPVVTIDSGDYKSDTWENKKDIKLDVTKDIVEHGKIVYTIDETGEWKDYSTPIVIAKDCKATVYTFKAISGAGVESDEKSITVKRDTTAPEEVEISYKEIEWKKFLNNVTFGLFFKDTVKVRLEAKEEGSGIKEFSYTMSGLSITSDAKDNALEFSIKPRFRGHFYYVTATDNAGNTSQESRTQSFAIDNAEPTPPQVNTNGYVSGKWAGDTVTFTLLEASAISGIAKYQYSTDGGTTWTDATVVRKIEATQINPEDVIEAKVEVSGNCKDVGYMFRAVSNVGIESKNSEETKVWIDEVEPVITVKGNTTDYLIKDTAKIEVTTVGESGVTKVEAKKDTGEYEDITASYTKDYEVTENGTYTFRVTNGAGVESEASIKYEKIDPRTPVVTIDSGDYTSDTWENKSDITLDVTEDLKHGVMQYKIGDGQWQEYSAPIVISEDCKATVYTFKATSGAGVVSEEESITIKRDTQVPSDVKIAYEKNGWTAFLNKVTFGLFFKDTVNVKLISSDDISGVKEFNYTLKDKDAATIEAEKVDATEYKAEFSIEPQYKGSISNVTATDHADNNSKEQETQHFAADKEVPSVPKVDMGIYTSGDWTKEDVTFVLSGASALSGIAKYQYSTDEGKSWNDATVVAAIEATDTEPYNMTQAKVVVNKDCKGVSYLFRAVSNSKIEGTNSKKTEVNIDKVVPTIQVTGKTDVYLVDDTATIAVTAGESKVTKVEVKKDSGIYTDIMTSYKDGYKVTKNGTYTFRVTNGAGVTSEASIKYEKIDSRTPVVTIDSGDYTSDTWENKSDITLDVTEDLKHGVMQYKIGDGQWQEYSAPIVISEDCKATVYTFKATSGAGVVSEEKSITVKRDTTSPDGDITFNKSSVKKFINQISFGLFFKENVDVKLTGTDVTSEVNSIEYTKSNKVLTQAEVMAVGEWTEESEFSLTPVDEEKFIIYVKVTDKAENVFVFGSNGSQFDLTSPAITGVSDKAIYYTTQEAEVKDKNLAEIKLDGNPATSPVSLAGDRDCSYVIEAKDKAGNTTSITVVMKPIASLTATIDALTTENVKSSDQTTVNAVKDAVAAVISGKATKAIKATKEEQAALQAIADKCEELLTKIEEVATESQRVIDTTDSYRVETVKSTDKKAVETIKTDNETLLATDNLTEKEREALTVVANTIGDFLTKLDQVAAESQRIIDAATSYNVETVKSADKETIETLKAASEALLATDNLTEEEREALTEVTGTITDILTKIEDVATENQRIIDIANSFKLESVKTADREALETLKAANEALLATDSLTEEESGTLTEVDAAITNLLAKVDQVVAENQRIIDAANSYNVETVKSADKEALETLKAAGEALLATENLTEEEREALTEVTGTITDLLTKIEEVVAESQRIIDTTNSYNVETVKSADKETLETLKTAGEALLASENLTEEEREALTEVAGTITGLLTKIEEVAIENQRIIDAANSYKVETVKSAEKEALEILNADNETLLATENLTEKEREALTEVAAAITNLLLKVDQVAAESQRIIDTANSYNVETVKSADKETLETLKAAGEVLLASENLMEEERAVLTEVDTAVKALLTKEAEVAAENRRIVGSARSFRLESVKSTDHAALGALKADNESLLATANLTEAERVVLTEVNDKINALFAKVDEAEIASEPESFDKVKDINESNVKMTDKEPLIQAKTELEQSLSGFEGNYTADEKAAIKEKIVQIEKALKAIRNVQEVIDAIAGLPKPGDVKKEDSDKIQAAKKLYDSLPEHEKSMIALEEIDKLTTAVNALEKEINKKPTMKPINPTTVPKAVKTGDDAAPMPYAVSMLLSCIILLGLAFGKRKTIRR